MDESAKLGAVTTERLRSARETQNVWSGLKRCAKSSTLLKTPREVVEQ